MQVGNELTMAYIEDTTTLIEEMDILLKKRNSIGTLDRESVDALFRVFHTIKASATAMDDRKTVDVSFKIENVVSYLRKHGPDALPAEDVIELMFNSEYFFRNRLKALKQNVIDKQSTEFENMLEEFIEDRDIEQNVPISTMVPVTAFMPICQNIVDSMSEDLGKKAEIIFDGDKVYIDRHIITRISAPIIQLVRNAMDHGIETPEERLKLGKPETGVITITYGLENGVLFITVFNDGRTLDLKHILRRADALNMLTKPRDQYKPQEVANLIMERGFTMKDKPGKYSGRGVGMDVLKATAQDMGGTILVNSGETSGFSITLAIPSDEKAQVAAIKENIKRKATDEGETIAEPENEN